MNWLSALGEEESAASTVKNLPPSLQDNCCSRIIKIRLGACFDDRCVVAELDCRIGRGVGGCVVKRHVEEDGENQMCSCPPGLA